MKIETESEVKVDYFSSTEELIYWLISGKIICSGDAFYKIQDNKLVFSISRTEPRWVESTGIRPFFSRPTLAYKYIEPPSWCEDIPKSGLFVKSILTGKVDLALDFNLKYQSLRFIDGHAPVRNYIPATEEEIEVYKITLVKKH